MKKFIIAIFLLSHSIFSMKFSKSDESYAMGDFDNIPSDVFCLILTYICDYEDIFNLANISKAFNERVINNTSLIRIDNSWFPKEIGYLSNFKGLKSLSIIRNPYCECSNLLNKLFVNSSRLSSLMIASCDQDLLNNINLNLLSNLRHIKIHAMVVDDKIINSLRNSITTLKRIILWRCNIADQAADGLTQFTNLEELNISQSEFYAKAIKNISALSRLRDLNISNTVFNPEDIIHLSGLTNIQRLNLGHTEVNDKSLVMISLFTDLRELNLRRTDITKNGLLNLSAITDLAKMDLSGCDLSSNGLDHLSALTNLTNLKLSNCRLMDSDIPKLNRFSKLNDLDLSWQEFITKEAINNYLNGSKNIKRIDLSGIKEINEDDEDVKNMIDDLDHIKFIISQYVIW